MQRIRSRTMWSLLGIAFLRGLWGAYMRRTPIYVDKRLAFLAHGDGKNDDTRYLQGALDDASGGGTVTMGRGILRMSKPATIRGSGVTLRGLSMTHSGFRIPWKAPW